ncbi:hypothetical protein [Paludisphaera borealis]|uniref:PEP-CTERM protein-sorting domain-containing protein n=1 Tax=Paludisphaera borealis TaxID=1387353 RepID=A0A1U7CSE2_9BACT|nr:hypothetical protein [Paludisphaera borealis]APW61816.1 hypothetical protein BSF38_03345 [Paludisphaera borealis]
MNRIQIAFLIVTLPLVLAQSASAALILSLDKSYYTIDGVGNTTAVQVFLSQTPDGPQVGAGNELLSAGIELTFATTGAATVGVATDVTPAPVWDASSVNISTNGSNTLVDLGLVSLLGISDLSSPLLLGTFVFTGQSLGGTDVSVATLEPGSSFITAQGDVLDPTSAADAVVTVVSATIPEPSALVMASLGGLISAGGCGWYRRMRSGRGAR